MGMNKLTKQEREALRQSGPVVSLTGRFDQESAQQDHPDYKKQKEVKTVAEHKALIVNPLTGKQTEVTIDRTGASEDKLALILSDKKASRDQKDAMLSQYLFQRGMESASFLAELFVNKGQLTKETREFKSQTRFDYELMINVLVSAFKDMSYGMAEDLEIDKQDWSIAVRKIINHDLDAFMGELKNKDKAILKMAARFHSLADKLREGVDNVTRRREQEKGYGIYINTEGKIYSIFDEDLDAEIEKDKKIAQKQLDKRKKHAAKS